MLRFLVPFCTLYVYSHGLKHYIMKILEKLDPKNEFFLERHIRVLAPENQMRQLELKTCGKSLTDLKYPDGSPLFTQKDLELALIVDD